jgi:hypothetical protein
MFYNARWYDPQVGRFAQADTIVPGGVQGLDRYAYVNNSPVNYVDPSGHMMTDGGGGNSNKTKEDSCSDFENNELCNLKNGAQLDFSHFDRGVQDWIRALNAYWSEDEWVELEVPGGYTFKFPLAGITSIAELREKFLKWYANIFQQLYEIFQGGKSSFNTEDIPSAVLGATYASYALTTKGDANKYWNSWDNFATPLDGKKRSETKYGKLVLSLYMTAVQEFGGGGTAGGTPGWYTPWHYWGPRNHTIFFYNSDTGNCISYPSTGPLSILDEVMAYSLKCTGP